MNKKILITGISLLILSHFLHAQVVVNEFSASNLNSFFDSNGKSEDWIELYNNSTTDFNIGGLYLTDRKSKPTKWMIPSGTIIQAKGFLLFWCSGRDTVIGGEYHTNFKLSQTSFKDSVVFCGSTGLIIEAHALDITHVEHSRCRVTDADSTWKICTNPTPGSSNDNTSQYNSYAAPVSFSLIAGFYSDTQSVSLSTTEPNSSIYYTTDGNAPTTASALYTGSISINSTTILKATAFSNDSLILPGLPVTNTYFINENFSLAVMSVGADSVKDLANGDGIIKPVGSIEYFDINGTRVADSYGSLNRHGQDSWVLNQRSIDWVSRDEMGHSKAIFAKLFNYSTRDQYQRVILRASGDDNYPAINDGDHDGSCHVRDEFVHTLALEGGMRLDVRAVERIIVFLNGEYWGVYGLRERPVDHDFIEEYYGHDKYEIQYLSTWASTEAEYGGQQAFDDWISLRDFILNSDMSIPANYQYCDDNLRLTSLCDYMIANLNCVASDWLNYNTGWYRGLNPLGNHKKWGYILWDNDATFDYYINYSGVPDISPNAHPCDIDDISLFMDDFYGWPYYNEAVGMHEKIFLKLQDENPVFRQLYFSRQADLINTVYSCDNMLTKLDSLVAIIDPEMDRQIARWGGSRSEWEANIDTLRSFVTARCNALTAGMTDCFEVTGPFDLTLNIEPAGTGNINLNTIKIREFPWTGQYFGNMDNLLAADPDSGYIFSHWKTAYGTLVAPDTLAGSVSVILDQTEGITAVYRLLDNSLAEVTAGSDFKVYPTIVTNKVTIDYYLDSQTDVNIQLFSGIGVRIADFSSERFSTLPGSHIHLLDLSSCNLAKGAYLLRINTKDNQITKRLFVQ